jgi:hypothetical protein
VTAQARLLVFLVAASLCWGVVGCSKGQADATFTVRVSGSPGVTFEGQCSSLGSDNVTDGVDLQGAFVVDNQVFEFEMEGIQIYCAISNEVTDGALSLDLSKDGAVVDSSNFGGVSIHHGRI